MGRMGRITLAGTGTALLMAALGATALAAGPGLPRTYDVQRLDSPFPQVQVSFGSGMASAGDVNGDGEDDLLLPQGQHPTSEGQVFVISGETGQLITTINAPDPGNPGAQAGNNTANFGFPWVSKIGRNQTTPPFSDIGSCAGGTNGALCPLPTIGPADGVPEIVVGARGVDARGLKDSGRVYIFDGRTRALLKRIDQPAEDTTPVALSRAGGTWFGRTALNPAGLPACEGNFGVGSCQSGIPRAVEIGDMDAGSQPDLVIGASATSEDPASAYPGSHCALTPGALCQGSGRAYIYRGEEIAGTSPAEILDGTGAGESFRKLRNPYVQADALFDERQLDSELFGNTLTAVGDVGRCTNAAIAPGDRCPRASTTVTQDGKPEVLVGALRVDYPVDNPDATLADVGVAFLVDGATGSILQNYLHPEPQAGATFSSHLSSHEPAAGDLGGTGLPDVFVPATGQNTSVTGGGRGYVMNGSFKGSLLLSRLDDSTPSKGEGFSSSAVGVGDLVGGAESPANELLVGATGGGGTPVINDVHFINGATEKTLQSIADPDRQAGSGFGSSIVPLGDLNEDGYLDFAVGSERYSGTTGIAQGRIYIFRSNNTPPSTPTPPPAPRTQGPTAPRRGGVPSVAGCPASSVARKLISLTSANDRQSGSSGPDTILAGAGNDVIDALGGDDCVDLGPGNDRGQGGAGKDLVLGGAGRDSLAGGAGADRLLGGALADRLAGGSGRDTLSGQSGGDRLDGDGGNDRISGGSGNDRISGGSGNDRISGGRGRDRISCGRGRDTVVADLRDRVARDCERVRRRK